MGKKSRLKRERRAASEMLHSLQLSQRRTFEKSEAAFHVVGKDLYSIFSKYRPEEVLTALGISDLWLPNISSQVKHQLAYGTAIAMAPGEFLLEKRLETYSAFCEFISAVHAALPNFPMLEDFVPEPDWGDVHVAWNRKYPKVFYGGNVERIPDFIEAFRLLHTDEPAALKDMEIALALQDFVIRHISQDAVGSGSSISPGHLEVPSEEFWLACRDGIHHAFGEIQLAGDAINQRLVLEQGSFTPPDTLSSFGEAVMQGLSLPAIMVHCNGEFIPVSLRNSSSVVIDYWTSKDRAASIPESLLCENIGRFLLRRFGEDSVVAGPLRLVSRTGASLPKQFAAAVSMNKKFYLIPMLSENELSSLGDLEQQVGQFISTNKEWAFLFEKKQHLMQFMRKDGTLPSPSDVEILAVVSQVSTVFTHVELPETNAAILFLPDFVSIFDSLKTPDEFGKFLAYVENYKSRIGPLIGNADLFASFRDSYSILIDGAVEPSMIALDPHWGSSWRFKELKNFWDMAPSEFPDNEPTWNIDENNGSLRRLIAKGSPTLAWSASAGTTTIQVVLETLAQELDVDNGRVLELLTHCLADSISLRAPLLSNTGVMDARHIVIYCRANMDSLVTAKEPSSVQTMATQPLFRHWSILNSPPPTMRISVDVNLARVRVKLESQTDASFEVECIIELLNGLAKLSGRKVEAKALTLLRETATRLPRFVMKRIERPYDVPDYAEAEVPKPEHYKIARRDLAVLLKEQGVDAPARYELATAKKIIDAARDAMRKKVHHQIAFLDKDSTTLFCIAQHDALTSEYQREMFRIKQSMSHEVSFDRRESLADAHEHFTQQARNYRYLIECCISSPAHGTTMADRDIITQLIASIDWLFVLYGASDVLHNDIEPAGIEVDSTFVPHVFYSEDRDKKEREFSLESAQAKLGIDLIQEDEVNHSDDTGDKQKAVDDAFKTDVGFSLSNLVEMFTILAHWHSVGGDIELRLCYQAPRNAVIGKLTELIDDLSDSAAQKLIDFATLEESSIRRLLGKTEDESDVPVWEHSKRGSRYTIRPLLRINNGFIAWGAAAADRAVSIWSGSISSGYLPASFNWPNVRGQVRSIKESIEKQLEHQTYNICSRATNFVLKGIDFKDKFPSEKFDDVGDFDVLAYWPETNSWINVECKYNQPPFCLKDARRLRERIFGTSTDDLGQLGKIERRKTFLCNHADRLRTLLGWPSPAVKCGPVFLEVYVARDIYWWMRNPPYQVTSHFVRVDGLDAWLRTQNFVDQSM